MEPSEKVYVLEKNENIVKEMDEMEAAAIPSLDDLDEAFLFLQELYNLTKTATYKILRVLNDETKPLGGSKLVIYYRLPGTGNEYVPFGTAFEPEELNKKVEEFKKELASDCKKNTVVVNNIIEELSYDNTVVAALYDAATVLLAAKRTAENLTEKNRKILFAAALSIVSKILKMKSSVYRLEISAATYNKLKEFFIHANYELAAKYKVRVAGKLFKQSFVLLRLTASYNHPEEVHV